MLILSEKCYVNMLKMFSGYRAVGKESEDDLNKTS
jgi:hypothetical protein